jgi:hypothetical protein
MTSRKRRLAALEALLAAPFVPLVVAVIEYLNR